MTLSEFITELNYTLRGIDDEAPTADSEEYDYWKATANRLKNTWARDARQTWSSLWESRDIGTISAGTQDYDLDDDFLKPSDTIYLTVNGNILDYRVAKPRNRDYESSTVYIHGRDPQVLTFVDEFVTGASEIGATITVPGYYLPEDMTAGSDTVPVDDPNWLVVATAAKIAFNDVTYEDKYSDLNAEANSLYEQMVTNNRKGTATSPNKVRVDVRRIRSTDTWY